MAWALRRRAVLALAAPAPLLLAIAAVLIHLRAYLSPDTLPMRGAPELQERFQAGDLTTFFGIFARVAIQAVWHDGVLPFWTPLVNGGSPVLEMPTAAPLALATWLGGLVRVEAAVKWSMLFHVALGMGGVAALGRALRISPPFAAVGALAFGLAPFLLDHFRAGHLALVYPMALVPWFLLCVWRALHSQNPYRWGVAGGAVLGVQLLEGADSALLYQAIALLLVLAGAAFGPVRRQYVGRAVATGVTVALAALVLGAPQLFPVLSFMRMANRGGGLVIASGDGGLSLEESLKAYREVDHPIPGPVYLLLALLGLAFLARRDRRAALWLALVFGAGFAIAYSKDVYTFLWHWLPGFRYQRIPQRALFLSASVGPIFVAAGAEGVATAMRRWVGTAGAWVAATVAVAFLFIEMSRLAPQMPPMASPEAEIASNHAMQWISEHNDGSRVHVIENVDRHWATDHVTVPLGLPAIVSWTTAEHRDYIHSDFNVGVRTFIDQSYAGAAYQARFWGMLNVRYVLSTTPQSIRGFHLATQVPPCSLEVCQPPKSAGPYIYENERWLPHAFRVPHAVAVVGAPRAAFEAALQIMRMPAFDPATLVVLQLSPGSSVPPVDVAVGADGSAGSLLSWQTDAGIAAVQRALLAAGDAPPPVAADFDRPDVNHVRITAPGEGLLVVSERIGLFPGWRATVDGAPVPIVRANGVLGALAVPSGAVVELGYQPPGFVAGVLVLGAGLALWLAFESILRRRRVQRSPAAPPG